MTRAQRVRAAMFPETVTNTKKPPPPFELPVLDPSKPMTALQTLAEPSQELKNAIADIINYQIDADFAQKFVPEIIKLLADPDGDVVRNAAELTADLSKSEAACAVMTGNDALTTALLRAAAAADGPTLEASKTRAAVAGTLLNYSEYERGRASIFRSGGIALLVRLLGSPAERVVNYAITTLHNLVQYQEGAKVAVRTAGGIQKMVPLLRWKDSKFLTININCLHMLAFGDPEAKIAIWNSRGPKELVAILKKTNDQKLLWTASRLVKGERRIVSIHFLTRSSSAQD